MRRPLVVVDGNRTGWLDRIADPVSVLTLGISAEAYKRANRERLATREISFVAAAPLARAAQEAVQAMYPEMLYRVPRQPVGGQSLLQRLMWRGRSLWWLTDMSEKSALRGTLISDMYALALIELARKASGADYVYIDSGRTAFRSVVEARGGGSRSTERSASGLAGFLGRLLVRRGWWGARLVATKAVVGLARLGAAPLSSTMFLTVHPLNWRNPYDAAGRDRIYGRLAELFASWRSAGFLALLSVGPVSLWRRRRASAEVFRVKRIYPLLAAATYLDVAAPFSPAHVGATVRAFRALPFMEPFFFLGYDVAPLLREEITRSLLAYEIVANSVIVCAVRRLASTGQVDSIIHWGEWQPVEKAVWAGVQGSAITTVAVQHSASSPMFLNYRFAAGELVPRDSAGAAEAMPLPALFATTGHYPREAAVAAGFPVERVRVCGPVRYPELARARPAAAERTAARARLGIGPSEPVALLVTASKRSDNVSMVAAFCEAAAGRALTVVAKCHPFARMEDQIASMLATDAPSLELKIVRDETSLGELLPLADILIGNSSASGLEALAAGVVPVFFHNPHVYDVSVLYSLRDSILLAADAAELRQAMVTALDEPARLAELRERWPEAVRYLLDRLDGGAEKRLLEFVRSGAG